MTSDEDEPSQPNTVKRMLALSMVGSFVFAVTGVGLGLYTGAAAILFDGLYSLISLALSLASWGTVRFMLQENTSQTDRYPFGRFAAEPLLILIKSAAILLLLIGGILLSGRDILTGGRQVVLGISLYFTGISAVLCLGIHGLLDRKGRQAQSDILSMESLEWRTDGVVSLSAFIGFLLATGLSRTSLGWMVVYVDPVLLLVMSLALVKAPFRAFCKGLRELMHMAPEPVVETQLEALVSEVKDRHQLAEAYLRASKVGSALFIEIDFVTGNTARTVTVQDIDLVREEIHNALQGLSQEPWLTVSFTEHRKWAV